MTVTYLVATTGRPGLEAALQSIVCQKQDGDQVLVAGATPEIQATAARWGCEFFPHAPGNDWGHSERNAAMRSGLIRGDYLAHLDDDDVAVMGSRVAIETAMQMHHGAPLIFKMHYAGPGHTLWSSKALCHGNVGTPMFVLPNAPDRWGAFALEYGGDFQFIQSCKWDPFDYVWVDAVIARIRPC